MGRFLVTAFGLLLGFYSLRLLAESEKPKTITLVDTRAFAIANNLEVHAAEATVEEKRAQAGRARAAYFPVVGVAAGADSEMYTGTSQNSVLGFVYGRYNIFNGFYDYYETSVAELEVEKAEIFLKQTKFRVGLDVERFFHSYIFKKISIDLKKKAVELNDTHKKMASQKRAAGMAADSDIIEFDLKDALLKSDLLLLHEELEESRTGLKKLLGEEIGANIEPVGKLQHQHLKGTLMDYMKQIRGESQGVQIAAKDVAISVIESKKANSGWMPKIDLEVAAGYLPWDERTAPAGTSMIGGKIVAKFDLFSGFETLQARRESVAKQIRQEHELKNQILSTVTATENAYRKISTIQARVDLEELNEQRAQKYYKSVLSEYRRGVKNSADLRVASDVLYDASLKRESFKFEFLTHRIELEQALGVPVPTDTIPET